MLKSFPASTQAVLIAILAYASFSHGDVLNKFLTQTYSVSTCLTVASAIGLIICVPWILMGSGWKGFAPKQWKFHMLRALIVAGSSHTALGAIKLLPLPEFYSIIFVAPIAVIILATLLKHETFRPHRLLTVALGFTGVLIIVGAEYQQLGHGMLLAFVCVICSAISVLLIRKIGQNDPLPVYCFFPFLAIFVTSAPFATYDYPMPDPMTLAMFLGFGLLQVVGHIAIPVAYAKAPQASLIAPVFYTQMLWGLLYGTIFFDGKLPMTTLLGASLIIGGGLYMIWVEKRKPRSEINTEIVMERE